LKLKIAYLNYGLSAGDGWGRYARELLGSLREQGVDPILLLDQRSQNPPDFTPDLPRHLTLASFSEGRLKPLRMLRDVLRARPLIGQCQIVHCLTEPYLPAAALLAGRRPLVATIHGTYAVLPFRLTWKGLYKWSFGRAQAVCAVSGYTARRFLEIMPEKKQSTQVIPSGVALPPLAGPFPPACRRRPDFLMVGHVKPRKGMLQAVEAMALVRRQRPDARLLMAGGLPKDDPYLEQVKDRIARLGLEEAVHFLGFVPQERLLELYSQVRGLVMPAQNLGTAFEGFGLVHLEANALGVPSVGSLESGNEEAIRHGQNGFLVAQGDREGLAQAMLALLDDDQAWDAMSANAQKVARRMNWAGVARSYVEVYRQVLKRD